MSNISRKIDAVLSPANAQQEEEQVVYIEDKPWMNTWELHRWVQSAYSVKNWDNRLTREGFVEVIHHEGEPREVWRQTDASYPIWIRIEPPETRSEEELESGG